MRYRIRHRTSYRYASQVFESFNEVRLQPLAGGQQTLLDFDLLIEPPATVISFRDYYGNAVHDFGVAYLHDRLVIEATSDVVTHAEVDEPLAGPGEGEPDASPSIRELACDEALADDLAEFLGPSAYVPLADGSTAVAEAVLAEDPETSALAFLTRAADHVRARLEFRVGATTVESSVAEVLAGGSGVCQDFAHVLISLCRHAGLPARYVSGYLGGVEVASASHAWAEAYVPPYGWLGVDATLGTPCTGRHVKLGVGRDYADVAVLRGTYQGGGHAELEVEVTCETLGGLGPAPQLRVDDEPTARLVAIQNLGAMRQFQRGAVMTQAMGGRTEKLSVDELPPPRAQLRPEDGPPSQQPQQQQQQRSGGRRMRLRLGCRFEHEATSPTPAVVLVEPHLDAAAGIVAERWSSEPAVEATSFVDLYGNRCRRVLLPEGASTFSYDALVTVDPDPEPMPGPDDVQHRVEALPDELLHWLLASRLCESDTMADRAWELFGGTAPGVERVQAVCDWINGNVAYGVESVPATTTIEIFERRGGMCRDFAHLGVTFCRALGIPARYVFGYMPDIGIPGPYPPMDFHAWFEVWLGSSWWTFDARFNTPRIGRLPIGRGRDAVDVAMVTTYGPASLRRMAVWTDEVPDDAELAVEPTSTAL